MASAYSTHMSRWLSSLPPVEFIIQQLRETLIGSLKCGPIPQHVAFVMDGNRRYARNHKLETVEGHHLGFEALAKILEVCYKSGVRVVTIFAFSIENFKRSKYEVDGLMDMAKTKLVQMSEHGELFDRYGASVRILGDLSLVREDVLEQVNRAVEMTQHNDQAVLNVCFPYTSREEITHSIRETVKEYSTTTTKSDTPKRPFSESHIQRTIRNHQLPSVAEEEPVPKDSLLSLSNADGAVFSSDVDSTTEFSEPDIDGSSTRQPASSHTSHSPSPVLRATKPTTSKKPDASDTFLDPETISAATLTKNTYTGAPPPDGTCPPLDLLVRTSGVQRLSDFMLWQCHENTEIRILDCLWPEFGLMQFLPVLLEWQWRQRRVASGEDAGLKMH
ncbi:dehydrodolichyl diphosphate synthase complex subunit [Acrodontium crateriforme]|uniref:Alkyl transferase n=1 Tax=Acrodontium crateriforme TaxID=150365 RepID=A0AAQ3R793_9PEZI|nr:dehydrodolichyl diphosphate synthase complex subunit [Acrodontium crateriforme]